MTARREVGLQFALVKEILDPKAQKRHVEEKIRAVEERNSLFLRMPHAWTSVPTCNQKPSRRRELLSGDLVPLPQIEMERFAGTLLKAPSQ
jgi:hypothetical protein